MANNMDLFGGKPKEVKAPAELVSDPIKFSDKVTTTVGHDFKLSEIGDDTAQLEITGSGEEKHLRESTGFDLNALKKMLEDTSGTSGQKTEAKEAVEEHSGSDKEVPVFSQTGEDDQEGGEVLELNAEELLGVKPKEKDEPLKLETTATTTLHRTPELLLDEDAVKEEAKKRQVEAERVLQQDPETVATKQVIVEGQEEVRPPLQEQTEVTSAEELLGDTTQSLISKEEVTTVSDVPVGTESKNQEVIEKEEGPPTEEPSTEVTSDETMERVEPEAPPSSEKLEEKDDEESSSIEEDGESDTPEEEDLKEEGSEENVGDEQPDPEEKVEQTTDNPSTKEVPKKRKKRKGYFPFKDSAEGNYREIIENLVSMQVIFDVHKEELNLRGAFSRAIYERSNAQLVLNCPDADIIARYMGMELDALEEEIKLYSSSMRECPGMEFISKHTFGMVSAMMGQWLLLSVADTIGCSDVDYGCDISRAGGAVVVTFEDFGQVYCGFDDKESAERFCNYMSHLTHCRISAVHGASTDVPDYNPFKPRMEDGARECLDVAQIYQAFEDYESEPHGLRGLLERRRNQEMMGQGGYSSYGTGSYGGYYDSYSEYMPGSNRSLGSPYGSRYGSGGYGSRGYGNRSYGGFGNRGSYNSYGGYGQQDRYGQQGLGRGLFGRGRQQGERGPGFFSRLFAPKYDMYGNPKRSLRKRYQDAKDKQLEYNLDHCGSMYALYSLLRKMKKKVPRRVEKKVVGGTYYTDMHRLGNGALAAYKVLQLTLSEESGVKDVLFGDIRDGGSRLPTVSFTDFCDLRLTFLKPEYADAFMEYMSDQFSLERIA